MWLGITIVALPVWVLLGCETMNATNICNKYIRRRIYAA